MFFLVQILTNITKIEKVNLKFVQSLVQTLNIEFKVYNKLWRFTFKVYNLTSETLKVLF